MSTAAAPVGPAAAGAADAGAVAATSTTAPPTALTPTRSTAAPAPGAALGSHYRFCFGCGDLHPTGLHMQMWAGEGVTARAQLRVTDDHQGAPGLAHGGLIASAFDEALGSLVWMLQTPAVTGRLETDYLRPVPIGSLLLITARCTGVQGRKIFAEAEGRLDRPDGVLAARAAGVFVQVGLDHFTRHGRRSPVLGSAQGGPDGNFAATESQDAAGDPGADQQAGRATADVRDQPTGQALDLNP